MVDVLLIRKRPILMSGLMVQAILREWKYPGTGKTQTRRMSRLDRFINFPESLSSKGWRVEVFVEEEGGLWLAVSNDECGEFPVSFDDPWVKCPYGKVGDRLWVREAFTELGAISPSTDGPLETGSGERVIEVPTYRFHKGRKIWNYDGLVIAYRANSSIEFCDGDGFVGEFANKQDMPRWKPSIHMPRKYARIELEITNIRIERLQDISEDDALDEGVLFNGDYDLFWDYECEQWCCIDAVDSYQTLINRINGKETWGRNPWVWVVEFKIVDVKGEK